jgi:hypothetical protein
VQTEHFCPILQDCEVKSHRHRIKCFVIEMHSESGARPEANGHTNTKTCICCQYSKNTLRKITAYIRKSGKMARFACQNCRQHEAPGRTHNVYFPSIASVYIVRLTCITN